MYQIAAQDKSVILYPFLFSESISLLTYILKNYDLYKFRSGRFNALACWCTFAFRLLDVSLFGTKSDGCWGCYDEHKAELHAPPKTWESLVPSGDPTASSLSAT